MKIDPVTTLYRAGSAAFRALPLPAADLLARTAYRVAAETSKERRLLVERNLIRALGPGIDQAELDKFQVAAPVPSADLTSLKTPGGTPPPGMIPPAPGLHGAAPVQAAQAQPAAPAGK